jgi:hypothetical protein
MARLATVAFSPAPAEITIRIRKIGEGRATRSPRPLAGAGSAMLFSVAACRPMLAKTICLPLSSVQPLGVSPLGALDRPRGALDGGGLRSRIRKTNAHQETEAQQRDQSFHDFLRREVQVSSITCDFQWAKRMSRARSSSSANGSGLRPARWQAPADDPVTTERSVWDTFALTRRGWITGCPA